MHFRIEQCFDLSLAVVEDVLCDPRFVEHMAGLPKLGEPRLLSHEVSGEEVHQLVRFTFAGELSAAVRRVLDPAKLTWVEESTIDRATHHTSVRILPDNYANLLRCEGTISLSSRGPGACTRRAEGEVKVGMPLVGARVEKAIISGLEEHADAEAELVRGWSSARPAPDGGEVGGGLDP